MYVSIYNFQTEKKEIKMKKIIVVASLMVFMAAFICLAADDAKTELRPAQKIMQTRKVWIGSINENLSAKKFDAVAKNAGELAEQTKKTGENNPNPLGKELTLAISSLAKDISVAAAKNDADTIKAKVGEIMGKCGECHTKIRDKK
jgi:cytochrome c556